MLINTTKFKPNEVVTMKLVTGEEIISRLVVSEGLSYKVSKPLVLSMTPNGVGMTPFLFTADIDGEIDIPSSAVVAITKTEQNTAGQYLKGTTGIQPATSNQLGRLV
jgi:hypothetical protein